MKSRVMLLAFVAMFVSCNKNLEVGIEKGFNVRINILDMVKDIKFNGSNVFPNGTIGTANYFPRVHLLIYDDQGSLYFEESKIVRDFSETVTMSGTLKSGSSTVVAIAEIVSTKNGKTDDAIDREYFELQNTSNLKNFVIEDVGYYNTGNHKILGLYKKTLTADQLQTMEISTESVGAFINFAFISEDNATVSGIVSMFNKLNDYYTVDEGKPYVITIANIEDWLPTSWETELGYDLYYIHQYFLPTQDLELIWGTLNSAEDVVNSGGVKFNVEKGNHKAILIDVTSGNAQVVPMASSVKSATQSQSLKINEMKEVGKEMKRPLRPLIELSR